MADLSVKFYRRFMFPVLDLRRGTKSIKYFEELKKSQWLDSEEISKLQQRKLKAIIRHAHDNVPYYHKVFKELNLKPEDIKSKEDLKKLPIMDKETVRNNFEDLKAKDFTQRKPIERTTGGTTGQPLKYYSDGMEHSIFWADLWRAWNLAGYELGDKRATIGGSKPSGSGFLSFVRSRVMESNLSLSSFAVKHEAMKVHVEKLKSYKPKILRGYPSSLILFAQYLKETKVESLGVGSVLTISEQLYPHQRKEIGEAFGCEVYDNYGCPDGGVLASECKEHEYHLNSENAVVEIVKDDEVVSSGEEGEMVSTNLVRYAMPFIRYRTGDLGRASDEKSKCKRGLEMLDSILGRTHDYILLQDGNLLAAVNIASVFNEISSRIHIRHYQVVQEKEGELDVLVVEDKGYTESDSDIIAVSLREYIGEVMAINVKSVDEIPLTESGKRRSVVSKLGVGLE